LSKQIQLHETSTSKHFLKPTAAEVLHISYTEQWKRVANWWALKSEGNFSLPKNYVGSIKEDAYLITYLLT
jgi:hypothetical protein